MRKSTSPRENIVRISTGSENSAKSMERRSGGGGGVRLSMLSYQRMHQSWRGSASGRFKKKKWQHGGTLFSVRIRKQGICCAASQLIFIPSLCNKVLDHFLEKIDRTSGPRWRQPSVRCMTAQRSNISSDEVGLFSSFV